MYGPGVLAHRRLPAPERVLLTHMRLAAADRNMLRYADKEMHHRGLWT
jgi:hypothetical protein